MTEILLKGLKTPNHYLISSWLKYCWKGHITPNHHHLISQWLKYCWKDIKHQTIISFLKDLNIVKWTLNTSSHFSMTEILLKGRKAPNPYRLVSPLLKYWRDVKHQTIISFVWLKYCWREVKHQTIIIIIILYLYDLNIVERDVKHKPSPSHFSMA